MMVSHVVYFTRSQGDIHICYNCVLSEIVHLKILYYKNC